jgi:aspartyl-tRNA(Asn)/glutamyl-tRNA(Gln) amidotransferase subunit B
MSHNLPYTVVIGLEVHVQLLTQTKLFCGCSTKFGLPPNSATCPVCIGMPGVLPVMNRAAFELALKAALALQCHIAPFTKWDRKNYYYPDLPKNYQISQYDLPFSTGGGLEIMTPHGPKWIGLIRVHLEEDAGKLLHDESGRGGDSLVDLNRAGTPLLEIVSRPDMNSPEEAKAYLEELRLLLRELGVSDCEMQEGSLRVDANVNIHIAPEAAAGRKPLPGRSHVATPIVEIKNLNSFRAVERAVAYEAQRQFEEFQQTGKQLGEVSKATAGWDDSQGVTLVQRRKEEASDYRYFPEPDLVPVVVEPAWLERIRASMPELPAARRKRFQSQFALSAYDARVLVSQGLAFADYFEQVAHLCGDAKAACNWCANQVLAVLNERKIGIDRFPLPPEALADLILQIKKHNINAQRAREVFGIMLTSREPVEAIVKRLGLDVTFDTEQLRQLVQKSIAANAKAVADVKAGKQKAIDALVGFVMRETKGKAPTDEVRRLMAEELAKV